MQQGAIAAYGQLCYFCAHRVLDVRNVDKSIAIRCHGKRLWCSYEEFDILSESEVPNDTAGFIGRFCFFTR